MWAGYLALANQQAAANGDTIGFIDPIIYPAALTSSYGTYFHDITSGSCGTYSAITGYDLCTGWGSPNTTGIINLLAGSATPSFTLSDSPSSLTDYARQQRHQHDHGDRCGRIHRQRNSGCVRSA